MGGLFGGGGTNTSATKIATLRVQSSAYGAPLPLAYGKPRAQGNLISYTDFKSIAKTTSTGGGKGGRKSTQTDYTYTAAVALALCEGSITGIGNIWADKDKITAGIGSISLSLFTGAVGQSAWGYMTTNHSDQALGYSGVAYVASPAYDLGTDAMLKNYTFELKANKPFNAGTIDDANPKEVLVDVLTADRYGAGLPATKLGDLTAMSNFCVANGIFIAPFWNEQRPASDLITLLCKISYCAPFFSEGVLKVVPYSDVAATGNGVTYTPSISAQYDLTDDDFIDIGGDPVTFIRKPASDCYNQVQVKYYDRASDYNEAIAEAKDQAAIELYGLRTAPVETLYEIVDAATAQSIAQMLLQRTCYIRNTYQFSLGSKYMLIEPMDIVTLTDASLGLNKSPVRITSIEEDSDGTLAFEAEEFQAGAAMPALYSSQSGGGYLPQYNATAENVSSVCIFEPPFALASGSGLEVWVGATGAIDSTIWGGCNVWVSYDGTTYRLLTTINNPARVGHLTAATSLSATSLALHLDGKGGQLQSASASDAAALYSLLYVGGATPEFMAYEGATLTGDNAYTLGGLVRGAYGSVQSAHAANDQILRVDDAVARSGGLDPSLVGSTIHFKLQSFNIWGSGTQDISGLSAYAYTITGAQATGAGVSGLTATAITGSDVLAQLAWNASPWADHYIIDQSGDGITWKRTGETKATTWADSALYAASTRFRVAAVRALPGAWSSPAFLSIGYVGMWNTVSSTPMWNANSAKLMWS